MKNQISLQEELSAAKEGRIQNSRHGYTISIPIHPFTLTNGEQVTTEFLLDSIHFKVNTPQLLSNELFTFPVNPTDGYIDASVFINNEHVPVNVYQLSFGESDGIRIPCRVNLSVHFSEIGMNEYADVPVEFRTMLKIDE